MRKLFALTLAVAMVLSLASVSFAAIGDTYLNGVPTNKTVGVKGISDVPYLYDADRDSGPMKVADPRIAYGKTAYYALTDDAAGVGNIISASDAVKSLKPKLKWDMGGDVVNKVEIVKKKFGLTANEYGYFLAVTFKDNVTTSVSDVAGKITLKKTSPTEWATGTAADREVIFNYGQSVGFERLDNDSVIPDGNKTFKFDVEDTEYEFSFDKIDGARFTVDVTGQDKIVLKTDAKYNAAVAAKYPAANLDFFNGNGASFNKIGELMIPAEEGTYLYALNEDGTLSKVNATYDEYEEGFIFKTRTLGKYVISDMELDLAATAPGVDVVPGTPSVTPPSVVTPANPGTGAAA